MIKTFYLDRDKLVTDEGLLISLILGSGDIEVSARKAWDIGAYEHIATFTNFHTEDELESVWHASNSGNGSTMSWSLDPMYPEHTEIVSPFPTYKGETIGHRSMSVGDICEMENGDRYVVASFGYKKI